MDPCYYQALHQVATGVFIAGFPHLSEFAKKDITNFIQEFYRQIESKDGVNFFLKNCGKLL